MSNRQISGAPFRRGAAVIVLMDESAYTFSNDVDEVHVLVADGTVTMPANPVIGQRHRVLALVGPVSLAGNGNPIVGGASVVQPDSGVDLEFSVEHEWVPFGFQNSDAKANVRVATTANIVLSGLQVIDGVLVGVDDRVLVKTQGGPVGNGIWLAAVGAWTRAPDMAAGTHAEGAFCFVAEGTVNADTGWVCTTNAPNDVVGTDPLAFAQFSSSLATVAPVNVTKAAAVIGTSSEAARADHKHDITTAAAVDVSTANAEGVSSSLARADHAHNLPFTPVQTALAAATGDVSVNGVKITDLDTPTLATDACTKGYADAIASGLDPKAEVRLATTGNIVLSGLQVIDGNLTVAGDRVLAKDQGAPVGNGIWIADAGAWTRATDMPAGSSAQGNYCFVAEGTANADKGFVCTTNAPNDIVGVDNIAFSLFTSFPLATAAPANVTKAAAAVGVSSEAARADHKHDITTAAAVDVSTANAEGASSSLARADHTHNLPFTPVQTALNAASGSVGFNSQNLTGVNSIAVLGGTASTEGGVRTPFSNVDQTIIGGKRAAGTQNDIIATLTDAIHIGKRPSSGSAWNYLYLVTAQYMVIFPSIQGQFWANSAMRGGWDNGGFYFGDSGSPTYGGGVRVINVQNAGTVPTSNPTNSFLIYSEAGAGKARGSGGTITTFAPADPHCPECGSDHGLEWETEDFDEYTHVCVRCLVNHVAELGQTVRELTQQIQVLSSLNDNRLSVPSLPKRRPEHFTVMNREHKAVVQ